MSSQPNDSTTRLSYTVVACLSNFCFYNSEKNMAKLQDSVMRISFSIFLCFACLHRVISILLPGALIRYTNEKKKLFKKMGFVSAKKVIEVRKHSDKHTNIF